MNRIKLTVITSIFFSSLLSLAACDFYEPTNLLINPDFEELTKKKTALGWQTGQHAGEKAYNYDLDSEVVFEGKYSFRIEQYKDQVYGIVSQPTLLPDRKNKKFTFTAMLKTKDVKVGDGWRLVVNCKAEDSYILKQYQSEPLNGTTEWQKVTLEGEIPEETTKLDSGIMLQSLGTGWADNVDLRVD